MISRIKTWLTTNKPKVSRRQREIEEYLSQAVDRYDLERRERALERKGYYWL